jgi:hypothetical protein
MALKGVIGNLRKMEGGTAAQRVKSKKVCSDCGKDPCDCEDERVDEPANIAGSN